MTPKQRALSALAGSQPDQLPVLIPYQGIFLRDHWDEITDRPWWVRHGYDLDAYADVLAVMAERIGSDIVSAPLAPARAWREAHGVEVVAGEPVDVERASGTRQPITRQTDTTTAGSQPPNAVQNVAELDQRVPVTPANRIVAGGTLDLAGRLADRLGGRYALMGAVGSPLWGCLHHFGLERGLLALYDSPDLVVALRDRLLARHLQHIDALAAVGVEVLWLEDCLTSRDVLGLDHFRELCLPVNAKMIGRAHERGLRVIHYFCGDVEDRLELLVDAGPDAIALEESKKQFDLDLARLAPRVPANVCIVGNVDAMHLLPNGSPEDIGNEVRRQARACLAGHPFIASLGSPVTPGTPTARVRQFTDTAHGLDCAFARTPS